MQGRELETQRLAAAGGQQREGVATGQRGFDDLALQRSEFGIAEGRISACGGGQAWASRRVWHSDENVRRCKRDFPGSGTKKPRGRNPGLFTREGNSLGRPTNRAPRDEMLQPDLDHGRVLLVGARGIERDVGGLVRVAHEIVGHTGMLRLPRR